MEREAKFGLQFLRYEHFVWIAAIDHRLSIIEVRSERLAHDTAFLISSPDVGKCTKRRHRPLVWLAVEGDQRHSL